MAEAVVSEKQSSIEVARNAKGEYSFKVKLYFDDNGSQTRCKRVNILAEQTMSDLVKRFRGK